MKNTSTPSIDRSVVVSGSAMSLIAAAFGVAYIRAAGGLVFGGIVALQILMMMIVFPPMRKQASYQKVSPLLLSVGIWVATFLALATAMGALRNTDFSQIRFGVVVTSIGALCLLPFCGFVGGTKFLSRKV
ncbi:MAG: hypothetical protein KDC26_12930 [Armatimonadetes bacterium]|nr:hypothetical protein [Armatimonadota bacterium]